ncbi:hypothetical protein ACV34R_30885, partial [Pseudomonas aeruginosa]
LGAVSLAGIAGAARSALRSRRCLLLWFELGLRLLPFLLLAQIGLLALALACAGTFEILGLWRVGQVPVSEGRTQLSVALILLGLLASAQLEPQEQAATRAQCAACGAGDAGQGDGSQHGDQRRQAGSAIGEDGGEAIQA